MESSNIPFLSVTELSELIKAREVSPVEVVDAYLERIERVDSSLHSYLTVAGDEAREAARESEQALARGEYRGPLHGIPVAVKDQLLTRGIRTTLGSVFFEDYIPDEDATVIAKLKAAGAILLGKLNMTEFGTSAFSHRIVTARNPWDPERFTGGSSSGSGGATAGFLCATSLGEDTGGSVRFPAAWCGLVGLRPTWGRVSRYGLVPGLWSMDTIGPLSRTVEDCALTLQAISGYDPKDPYTSDVPTPEYRQALSGGVRGLRVGIIKEQTYADAVDPEVREAVLKASSVLGELGASVEEVSIPLSLNSHTISSGLRQDAPLRYHQDLRERLQEIGHDNRIAYLTWSILPAVAYYKAQKLRYLLRQQVMEAFDRVDLLLQPTATVVARKVEPDPIIQSKGGPSRNSCLLTMPMSLANVPAASICCGFNSENLPIALQIAGRPLDEGTVLKAAYAYEQNTPWHTRKPPPL